MAFITFVADAKKAKCRFLLAFRAQVIQTFTVNGALGKFRAGL